MLINILAIEECVQLFRCYTQSSYLLYSEDTKSITLNLVSANNSACSVFPKGMQFNLSLAQDGINQYSAVIRDFNYSSTTSVTFQGVTHFNHPTSAFLKIFDYGQYTLLEIQQIQQKKSDLSNCFSESIFRPRNGKVELQFTGSGECGTIFDKTNVILKSAQVNVNGNSYDVEITDFLEYYSTDQSFVITTTKIDYPTLKKPFLSTSMIFNVINGAQTLQFSSEFKTFDGQLIRGIIPNPIFGLWQDGCFIFAEINISADVLTFLKEVGKYDAVEYRISFQSQENSDSYSHSQIYSGDIDNKRQIFYFKCNELISTSEQKQCQNIYDRVTAGEKMDEIFDVIFLLNGVFVVKYTTSLTLINTCWTQALQLVSKTQNCMELTWNDLCKTLQGNFVIGQSGFIKDGIVEERLQSTIYDIKLNPEQTRICFPINNESQWLSQTKQYYIEMNVFDKATQKTYYVVTNRMVKNEYKIAKQCVITFSAIILCLLLITSILDIIKTAKLLRQMRKSKKGVE